MDVSLPLLLPGAVGFLVAYAAGGTNATGKGASLLATTFVVVVFTLLILAVMNFVSGQGVSLTWNMTVGALVGAVPGYYRGLKSGDNAIAQEVIAASKLRRSMDVGNVPMEGAQAALAATKKSPTTSGKVRQRKKPIVDVGVAPPPLPSPPPPPPPPIPDDGLLHKLLAVDPRSLAALRVSLGLCVLGDLWLNRSFELHHYTDAFISRGYFLKNYLNSGQLSVYMIGGSLTWVAIAFALHTAVAISMVLGLRTRTCAFLTWLFQCGIVLRSLPTSNGGDFVLLNLLLWMYLQPDVGKCFTLDRIARGGETGTEARDNKAHPPRAALSWAGAGLVAFLPLVYVYSGWCKIVTGGPEWNPFEMRAWSR